jgi:hypothetical protein
VVKPITIRISWKYIFPDNKESRFLDSDEEKAYVVDLAVILKLIDSCENINICDTKK